MNKETELIQKQAQRSGFREHSVPIYLTSSFTFDSAEQGRALFAEEEEGNIYSRFSNPNTSEFIERLCILEGTETGLAFSTGMAAVFSSFAALLSSGDHIIASRSLFGSTHQILTKILVRWGITHTYVDAADTSKWQNSVNGNTKMIFIETPSNPGLDLIDLEWLGKFKKDNNLILAVDNCFATPVIQQPADYGADLIIHSATKFIDGQGRVLGGAVLGSKELIKEIKFFARQSGPAMSPFNAWVLSKSLETLHLRMEKHSSNALAIAEALQGNTELEFVRYPFSVTHPQYQLAKKQMKYGGGIVTFSVKGGTARAHAFIDQLQYASKTANLGDTRTIVTHPASTTHSKLADEERAAAGITPGLIRISAGLENSSDIITDIITALESTKSGSII